MSFRDPYINMWDKVTWSDLNFIPFPVCSELKSDGSLHPKQQNKWAKHAPYSFDWGTNDK